MRRRVLLGALGLLMILAVPVAYACPLCLGGVLFAPGQQLDVAEQAVLAGLTADGTRWRIIEVAKGHAVAGQAITEAVDGADAAALRAGRPVLLLRHEQWPRWSSVGTIGVEYAGWLRQLAATGPRADRPDVDWRIRVALVAPYLESPEPLAADIAYGEIARALRGSPLAQGAARRGNHRQVARRSQACRPSPRVHAPARGRGRAGGRGAPRTAPRRGVGGAGRDQPWGHARGRPRAARALSRRLDRDEVPRRPRPHHAGDRRGIAGAQRARRRERGGAARAGDPGVPRSHQRAQTDGRPRGRASGGVGILGRRGRVHRVARVEGVAGSCVARRDHNVSRTVPAPARARVGRARLPARAAASAMPSRAARPVRAGWCGPFPRLSGPASAPRRGVA